jgi:hypothetical protein
MTKSFPIYKIRDIRIWVILLLIFLSLFGTLKLCKSHYELTTLSIVFYSIGVFYFFLGMLIPNALQVQYHYWMRFAHALGWLNTRVLLTITFYLVFTPIGLFMRLIGKNPLNRGFTGDTYWHERTKKEFQKEDFLKQY